MKIYFIPIVALTMLAACNNNEHNPKDSTEAAKESNDVKFDNDYEKDAEFAVKAADGGMFEVEVARLVLTKTSNADVKALAEMMKTDHSTANSELKGLAMKKNITLPDSMSNDMRKKYNDLSKKSGKDFDEAYVDLMIKDHKNDIDLFQKEADKGNEQEMKSWASAKLPVLEHHLTMSEQTKDKLRNRK